MRPPVSPPESSGKEIARRILIVDDNQDSAKTMAMLQDMRGHETRIAFTGPDAITIARSFLPEVILLDIGLPGMNGLEVASSLRAISEFRETLLIALSGYGGDDDRAAALAAGFDRYMVKPADLKLLSQWLRNRS